MLPVESIGSLRLNYKALGIIEQKHSALANTQKQQFSEGREIATAVLGKGPFTIDLNGLADMREYGAEALNFVAFMNESYGTIQTITFVDNTKSSLRNTPRKFGIAEFRYELVEATDREVYQSVRWAVKLVAERTTQSGGSSTDQAISDISGGG